MIRVTVEHQSGFLISKIYKQSQQIFNQKLSENGLKIHPGQGRVLFVLWKQDNIPIKVLVEKTGLPKTTLTSILDRLEQDGHLIRERSIGDKREIYVKLTDKNKKDHKIYEKISQEMGKVYYQGFNDNEKTELDKYLNRILDNLREF